MEILVTTLGALLMQKIAGFELFPSIARFGWLTLMLFAVTDISG